MTDSTGHSDIPFSSHALRDLVAKDRRLGLTDEVLAIQLQLTREELTRIASGDETWMAA